MEARIKKVLSDVLGVPETEITDDATPDTVESWDSLKHMNLLLALEEEFNIKFNDEENINLISYPLIKLIVSEKTSR